MAFMQMKRLGDERARRKGFENVFDRFDKNKNGRIGIASVVGFSIEIVLGSMYVKDFLKELDRLNIKIGQEELDEINRISDSTGKVSHPLDPKTNHSLSRSRKESLRSTPTIPRFTKLWTKIGTGRSPLMSWKARQR